MEKHKPLKTKKSQPSKRKKVLLATLIPLGSAIIGTTTFFCVTAALPKYLSLTYLEKKAPKIGVSGLVFNADYNKWVAYFDFFTKEGVLPNPLIILKNEKSNDQYTLYVRPHASIDSNSFVFSLQFNADISGAVNLFCVERDASDGSFSFSQNTLLKYVKTIKKTDGWFPSFEKHDSLYYDLTKSDDDLKFEYVNTNVNKVNTIGSEEGFSTLLYVKTHGMFLP